MAVNKIDSQERKAEKPASTLTQIVKEEEPSHNCEPTTPNKIIQRIIPQVESRMDVICIKCFEFN